MNKKPLYIIIFIILVIGFGAMIYFVFLSDIFAPDVTNQNINTTSNENINGSLPLLNGATNVNRVSINTTNVNRLVNGVTRSNINTTISNTAQGGETIANKVTDTPILAPEQQVGGDGIRFYDISDGKFYYIDENGNKILLSDQVFPQAEEIAWSPVNNEAIITFPDQSKVYYDFNTQEQVTLPREWDEIDFSPTGSQIGFKNVSSKENERWLAVSNPDGSGVALVEPMGDKVDSVAVNWSPTGQVVATYREGYSADGQEIYLIGLNDENFKSIVTDGRGFEGVWSADGKQMIYSVYSEDTRYNPSLYLVDSSGDQIGSNGMKLGLQTWSNKCTFSSNSPTLYCAVPGLLETGTGIYPSLAGYTNDKIYKINTNTGTKEILATPSFLSGDINYTINSMFLSQDENSLYFTDASTNTLYNISL